MTLDDGMLHETVSTPTGSNKHTAPPVLHHANNRNSSATAVPSPKPEISSAHQGAPCGRLVKAPKGQPAWEAACTTRTGCLPFWLRRDLRNDCWSDMGCQRLSVCSSGDCQVAGADRSTFCSVFAQGLTGK